MSALTVKSSVPEDDITVGLEASDSFVSTP